MSRTSQSRLHEGSLLSGFFVGFVAMSVVMLLIGPRIPARRLLGQLSERGQTVLQEVERRVTADPMTEAMEKAKSAAHRRRQMLNATLN